MTDTILRQWNMLQLVPRHPRWVTAPDLKRLLAERDFDVTVRTIQRDLEKLSATFPLTVNDRGRPFGWSWPKNYLTEIPGIEPAAALSFVLIERHLDPILPRTSLEHLQPYFERSRRILDRLHKPGLGQWPDKVRTLPRGIRLVPKDTDPQVIEVVYEALLKERQMRIAYQSRGSETVKSWVVHPLGMVIRDAITYLVVTIFDYQDIRQLVLHRIQSAQILRERRNDLTGFNLETYVQSEAFRIPLNQKPVRIVLKFQKEAALHLFETSLSPDQVLKEDGGDVVFKATVPDTKELHWWILGFGDQVEVLKPKSLRQEFQKIAARLHARYARDGVSNGKADGRS